MEKLNMCGPSTCLTAMTTVDATQEELNVKLEKLAAEMENEVLDKHDIGRTEIG